MEDFALVVSGLLIGAVIGFAGGFCFTSLVFFSDFDDYLRWVEIQTRSGKRDISAPYARPRKMPWEK